MPQNIQQYFIYSPFFTGSTEMPELAWEKLQDKIDELPQSLANLISDAETAEFLEALTQKYVQLSVQGPDIARLIRDVVIADVFIGDMPKEIPARLGIDPATAREVANQIVSQLFAPVLEDLKKVHREKFPGRLPDKLTPLEKSRPEVAEATPPAGRSLTGQDHYQGEEVPA